MISNTRADINISVIITDLADTLMCDFEQANLMAFDSQNGDF